MSFALQSHIELLGCEHDSLASSLDTKEVYCSECTLEREPVDAQNAYQIVDEGNLIYPKVWSTNKGEPSQHDWVSSKTKLKVPAKLVDGSIVDERYEFLEELGYNIGDRLPSNMFPTAKGFIPLLAPLEMFKYLALPKTDTICNVCHLQINKYVECPHW